MIGNGKTIYTKGQFLDFCQKVFGDYRLTTGGTNIQVVCPACAALKGLGYSKKKLAISTDADAHLVHCWVCGYKSKSIGDLIKKYFPEYLQNYRETFANSKELTATGESVGSLEDPGQPVTTLPEGFILLATADASRDPLVYAARNYLKARAANSEEMLWYWRLGVSRADRRLQDRIIVPSFDKNGVINYYSARTIKSNIDLKYVNPDGVDRDNIIFNELNIDWSEELVIVEGVFDLIKCSDNAACLLGSDLPTHFKLFQEIVKNKTPVVLALDPDAIERAYVIANRLTAIGIRVRILNLKPHQEDIGGLRNKTEFNELLEAAIVFDMEYFLRTRINKIV